MASAVGASVSRPPGRVGGSSAVPWGFGGTRVPDLQDDLVQWSESPAVVAEAVLKQVWQHGGEAACTGGSLAVSSSAVAFAALGALWRVTAAAGPHPSRAVVAAGTRDLAVVAAVFFDGYRDVEPGDAEEVVLCEHREHPALVDVGRHEVLAMFVPGWVLPIGFGSCGWGVVS